MTFSFQSEDEGFYFSQISKGFIWQIMYSMKFWQFKERIERVLLLYNINFLETIRLLQSGFSAQY